MPNKPQKSIINLKEKELIELFYMHLKKYGGFKLTGFGMFTLVKTKGIKNGMNPFTQKRENFPRYVKIKFRPIKQLKEEMQKWKN